jgi:Tfp pilus assembly protein PilF
MLKKIGLLLFVFVSLAPARDKVENWVQVRSPHFIVATNSSEKQGRRIAGQFERMRSVFHALFPKLQIDPSSPIIVLAIKDEKDFRALEPEAYLAKGSLQLGGLFLRAPEKNYVLMRVEAEGDHPYSVVYHEYTHLLLSKADWMPLWLNEGMASFYENTEIEENEVLLGKPSVNEVQLLRESRLLPLATLFAVDFKSPYYHEEQKGSIFYSESWALTHYLHVKDFHDKTARLPQYSELLAQKVDPITAATTAFGDLKKLEAELQVYVRQTAFTYFKKKLATDVDDSAFTAVPLTAPQADAVRADFLVYNQRIRDARTLLDHVLHDDPNNVSARETMGFLEFRDGHIAEAKKWYEQAVQLDSQSYLSHYFFAVMAMQDSPDSSSEAQVENSLRQAIKLNPTFAPAFDRLAVFLASRRQNLDEAHMMGLTAVTLDPGSVGYRVNVAMVLMEMQRGKDAVEVLRNAMKLAKTSEENEMLTQALIHAEEYSSAQAEVAEHQRRMSDEAKSVDAAMDSQESSDISPERPRLVRRDFVPSGPHRFVTGVIKDVHCEQSVIDMAVKTNAKTVNLHSDNYYKLQFSALGFTPSNEMKPCSDLEGRPAKVEYVESSDKSQPPRLLSVELHK